MSTYTAGDIAVPLVPSFDSFFQDINSRIRRYEPPDVRITPDVDTTDAEHELGRGGKLVAAAAIAGAAIGAVLTKAIGDAMDFSAANGKLQAQLGLSSADAGRYGKIAGDLYSQAYGDSIGGVNDALKAVMQSGALAADATDQQIQGVTGSVLNLSTAFGVDATDAANALGQMMRTGLAPDAQTALDVIYRGFQLGDDKAGDFLDTLNEYGTQFRKLGLNAADATGLISQGLQAGARDSDLVADAIKEFSIRAVDGSKTTSDGFAAIGLNADKMAQQIGAGGDTAKTALGQVLDGLRGIKDPAAQAQAATELFGTQAEDLGDALFALHPETAADGLGQIAGAADGAGDALMTPASRVESFQRTLQTSIVDFVGGRILPIFSTLVDWGKKIFDWGPVPEILSFLGTTGGVAVGAILAIVGAIKAWTLAQTALNVVMDFAAKNPIVMIIGAIAALVAGLIWAYNNVGWFRDFVDGAFRVIGAVASWLWNNAIKPAFDAIGAAATWLWQNVLQPAFRGIGAVIEWVWTNMIKPQFDAMIWLWQNVLSPVLNWLWHNIFEPAFQGIGAVIGFVWNSVIKPAFDAMVAGVNWVKDGFQAAVDWIGRIWEGIKRLVAAPVNFIINTVWKNGIVKAWNWVADLLPGVSRIDPDTIHGIPEYASGGPVPRDMLLRAGEAGPEYVLSAPAVRALGGIGAAERLHRQLVSERDVEIGAGLGGVSGSSSVGAGGAVWQALWNIIRGAFPAARLTSSVRPGAADYHGAGKAIDIAGPRPGDAAFMLGVDQWIARNYPGSTELIHTPGINLKNGRPFTYSPGIQAQHYNHVHWAMNGFPGAAGSNAVGFTGSAVGYNWFQQRVRELVNSAFDGIMKVIPFHGPPAFLDIPQKMAEWGRDKVLDFLVGEGEADAAANAGGGGSGVEQWRGLVLQALAFLGLSPADADRTLRRMNQESGGNPRAINNWDSNAARGTPSKGLMQVIDPTFRAYRDPSLPNDIWDPMANVVASMRYARARYGSLAAAYDRPGGYDSGGWLPPGLSTVYNGTSKPEAVLTSEQWDLLSLRDVMGRETVASLQVQAREPMTPSEISRLASEMVRQLNWNRRTN
ncbi:phage tail tape measure protein [Pseudonocardia benzenivorans]